MLFFQKLSLLVSIVVCTLLMSTNVPADPLLNQPGTRARAMGGAFAAVADDASAIWYNPAGLAFEGRDLIVEVSDSLEYDLDDGLYKADDTSIFLAGKFSKSSGRVGFGMSFYEPYKISYYGSAVDSYGSTYEGVITEDINQLSFGWGGGKSNLKLGISVDLVYSALDEGNSQLTETDQWGGVYDATYQIQGDSAIGLAASVGVIYVIPVDTIGFNAKIGGTYRTKSSSSSPDYMTIPDFFVERPSSWDVGASIAQSITSLKSTLVLSAQLGETDYGSMGKFIGDFQFEKTSFGAEYVLSSPVLFFESIAFRAGKYTSKEVVDGTETGFEVTGTTFGIGTLIGDHFGVDVTKELRDFNISGYSEQDMYSMALTWFF